MSWAFPVAELGHANPTAPGQRATCLDLGSYTCRMGMALPPPMGCFIGG